MVDSATEQITESVSNDAESLETPVGGYDAPVVVPASALTHAGFREWAGSDDFPARGRISFLDGQIWIDMSPESGERHNTLKAAITSALFALNDGLNIGRLYADRMLLTHSSAGLSTEPDAMFATWSTLKTNRLKLLYRQDEDYHEVSGTPDWVLEIVSKTSVRKDTQTLRRLYHKAEIPEYWLIDARGETVDFQMLTRKDSTFQPVPVHDGWRKSAVFQRDFKIERKHDPLGHWAYRLVARTSDK